MNSYSTLWPHLWSAPSNTSPEAVTLVTETQKWHHISAADLGTAVTQWYCRLSYHKVYFTGTLVALHSYTLEYSDIVLAEVQQATMPQNRWELLRSSNFPYLYILTQHCWSYLYFSENNEFLPNMVLVCIKSCMFVVVGCPNTFRIAKAKHLLHIKILVY